MHNRFYFIFHYYFSSNLTSSTGRDLIILYYIITTIIVICLFTFFVYVCRYKLSFEILDARARSIVQVYLLENIFEGDPRTLFVFRTRNQSNRVH